MKLNVDINKKAIERNLKIGTVVLAGAVAISVTKNVFSIVRGVKQSIKMKKVQKQLDDIEARLEALEIKEQK